MDEFVTQESHGTTGEARHAWYRHWNKSGHHSFHHLKSVADHLLPGLTRLRRNPVRFHHTPLVQHLHPVGGLPDDRARTATHEGITPQVFATLDGLEEERFTLSPQLLVGGQRGFKIREQATGHRDAIPLAGQHRKLFSGRRVHDGTEPKPKPRPTRSPKRGRPGNTLPPASHRQNTTTRTRPSKLLALR